jgi:hypothetical protein
VLSCDTPVQNIEDGKILTKRKYHRYGDHVEYNCNIGYTPRRIVRFCSFDGQWSGTEPVCQGQYYTINVTKKSADFLMIKEFH